MIEILHYILDVLWTVVRIAGAVCVLLFIIVVTIEIVKEALGRKNG
jgi:hypothetical protein